MLQEAQEVGSRDPRFWVCLTSVPGPRASLTLLLAWHDHASVPWTSWSFMSVCHQLSPGRGPGSCAAVQAWGPGPKVAPEWGRCSIWPAQAFRFLLPSLLTPASGLSSSLLPDFPLSLPLSLFPPFFFLIGKPLRGTSCLQSLPFLSLSLARPFSHLCDLPAPEGFLLLCPGLQGYRKTEVKVAGPHCRSLQSDGRHTCGHCSCHCSFSGRVSFKTA